MGDSGELYERVAVHAERPGFRISEIRLNPTQRVPWHHHSNIQDTFYVLSGRIRITLRGPEEHVEWASVRIGDRSAPDARISSPTRARIRRAFWCSKVWVTMTSSGKPPRPSEPAPRDRASGFTSAAPPKQ